MTVTYPVDPQKPYGDRIEAPRLDAVRDEPFVPVYARTGRAAGRGKIRTWMIMAPVGALALAGIAVMLMTDGQADAPLAEPAATAPVLPAIAPLTAAPAALTPAATPAPAPVAAAPAVRETAPVRRAAPAPAAVRRVAPRVEATVAPRAAAPAPAAAPTVGPQPYAPAPAGPTSSLNTAPTPAPTPAPIVVVAPQG